MVATAVGGTPEVITDGESGRLVPPGDPAALAREISRLVQDHEMRNGFVSRGRAVARAVLVRDAGDRVSVLIRRVDSGAIQPRAAAFDTVRVNSRPSPSRLNLDSESS